MIRLTTYCRKNDCDNCHSIACECICHPIPVVMPIRVDDDIDWENLHKQVLIMEWKEVRHD